MEARCEVLREETEVIPCLFTWRLFGVCDQFLIKRGVKGGGEGGGGRTTRSGWR